MANKRGQNEGSIYKRKDGRWVGQVTVEGRQIYQYSKTQREARQWVQQMQSQIDKGLTLVGTQSTLAEYMEHWLKTVKSSVRPNTWVQYTQITHQHILPSLGKIKLNDLKPAQIQSLYNSKLNAGASPRTVRLIHSVLRRSLNIAMKQGLLSRNPAHSVTQPKLKPKEMQTLTDVQVRTLLLAARKSRFEVLYYLAVTTGLREGEILGLKWSDLDWNNRHLQIQRQLHRVSGEGLIFSEPKSSKSKRVIVLGKEILEKLREHFQRQQQERLFADQRWQENDLVFPSTIGTPMEPRNLLKDYKDLLNKAGLPNIRFHDLRHTAATLMLQQGTNPKIVQERLGHSTITLTLDTYSHVLPAMQEEVAEKMDEITRLIDVRLDLAEVGGP